MDISYCSIDIVGDPTEFSHVRYLPAPSAHETENKNGVRDHRNIREVGLPLYLMPARLEIAASGNGAKRLLSGRLISTRNAGRNILLKRQSRHHRGLSTPISGFTTSAIELRCFGYRFGCQAPACHAARQQVMLARESPVD
ncbi:hypothetical protein RFN29_31810 [Mesorhizobium sp. VK22B]|uniref:Uncharacterized protein n=1 Tax=Mesorhizobium captivum TaxID=3072319 RepID=A0ABU4ZB26_9HYPH|nr:hypothetical protein [Mesorhizobium sp. VK22B]MDX8496116.1 hypothetical protein [Mesorhizobium sp. VK22B]